MDKITKNQIVFAIVLLLAILIREYYEIRHINFVCNTSKCAVIHEHSSGRIISQQDININDIEQFIYKLERNNINSIDLFASKNERRRNYRLAYHLYVKCKDNNEYRIEYVSYPRDSFYKMVKIVDKLNEDIKKTSVDINMEFPSQR